MATERFETFDYAPGKNRIREWLDEQGEEVSAEFEAALNLVEGSFYGLPLTNSIKGKKYKGLFEIRFKVAKVQWRMFYCYAKFQRGALILLAGGYHKQHVYHPPSVLDTALSRKNDAEN